MNFNLGEFPVGLGCMSLPEDYFEVEKVLSKALELGIRFFDTADLYQKGVNEENLGRFFQHKRNQVKIATKVGNQLNPNGESWSWNPSSAYILKAVEDSLKRLRTDYLDLYQLHGGTLEDPWEETLEAFEKLQNQGKILSFGISSIRPNVIRKVMSIKPPATVMMQYSPLDRRPEEEIFPYLETTETKVLVRGGFAKGLLIDKPIKSYLEYTSEQVLGIRKEIANSGYSPESVLIKFALNPKAVGGMVIGASNALQVEKSVRAFEKSEIIPDSLIQDLKGLFPANRYHDHR
jgi:aryl-alcohol dehydrogenase-like predicted oxidoreductase